MTDTFGARPWSEVINETGGNINESIRRNQGLQAQEDDRQRAEAEKNRALHPATAKWLARVMNGEDPAEMARGAHAEIDGMGQPSQAPMVMSRGPAPTNGAGQDYGQSSDTKLMSPGEQGSPMYANDVSMGRGPVAPTPSIRNAPERPMNQQDVGDLNKLAPVASALRPRADGMEVTRERGNQARLTEEAKNTNRVTGQDRKFTHEQRMHDATIQQKYWHDAAMIKFDYDKLQAYIDKVHEGTATAKEIAAARLLGAQIVASIGASAKDASSLVNDSDPAIADQKANHDRMQFNTERQLALLGIQGPQPGEPTSGVDGPVYKPNGAGMGVAPEGQKPTPIPLANKKPAVKANPDRPPLPASMGTKVRVRLNATGKTGSVDANEFNPKTMTKISG